MKPIPASVERMNSAATRRSAFLARRGSAGSAGSHRRSGRALRPSTSASIVRASAGGGVPMTRRGAACASGSSSGASGSRGSLIGGLSVLRGYPHPCQHHEEQQAEEREQALGHRPDAPQAEAAGVALGPGGGDVRDDVPFLVGSDRG